MKKYLFLFSLICTLQNGTSQCDIHPFIEDNYKDDAYTLLFREFVGFPDHPNYEIPILDESKIAPYLEKLSAIYEETINNQTIDSLFNYFQIHTNNFFPKNVPFGQSYIWIPEETPWLFQFIDTGISGNPELDNLMATFQFEIISIGIAEPPPIYFIELSSPIPYLNTYALIDNFIAVDGISDAEVGYPTTPLYNYSGPYFEIENEEVRATNIYKTENEFIFSLHTGPCWLSCDIDKAWLVTVSEDCETVSVEILSNKENKISSNISVFPNPSRDKIFINSSNQNIKTLTFYNIYGKTLPITYQTESNSINISTFSTGIYFLKVETLDGKIETKKIIKL
ncbi:MAG: T9SS type A sorting domain-containing protein [Flavobacteriaceae bacterium]